jgi:hypothetical protein
MFPFVYGQREEGVEKEPGGGTLSLVGMRYGSKRRQGKTKREGARNRTAPDGSGAAAKRKFSLKIEYRAPNNR